MYQREMLFHFMIDCVDEAPFVVVATPMETTYLDRCNLFLGPGFDPATLSFIKKIVRSGGGSMPSTFDGFVTHLILASTTPSPEFILLTQRLETYA